MQYSLRAAGMISALLLLLPAYTYGKSHNGHSPATAAHPATPQDYSLLLQARSAVGRVLSVDEATKTLTLEVQVPTAKRNGTLGNNQMKSLVRRQRELEREQLQLIESRSPEELVRNLRNFVSRTERQQQTRAARNGLHAVPTKAEDFDLQLAEDFKVREKQLPDRYDEKGNLQPYTAQELRDLKSPNPNLPGYAVEFGGLQTGQTVQVYVVKRKVKSKTPGQEQDKGQPTDSGVNNSMEVPMALIVKEAPPAPEKRKKNRK